MESLSDYLPVWQAWMRSRGDQGTATFTAETMAEQFGVVKGTYDAVSLPKIKVNMVYSG